MPGSEASATPPVPSLPLTRNPSGSLRRVGVEIEFANLPVPDAARLVQRLFGGGIARLDEHRYKIADTPFGDFAVELDAAIAHPQEDQAGADVPEFEEKARGALGHAISAVVPTEIICPPIPWPELGRLEALIQALRQAGAEGTDAGTLYGFGLQLNPELAQQDVSHILAHLRAYGVLELELRQDIGIDPMRRLLPYIDPFPPSYLKTLLAPDYAPDRTRLMRDHIRANRTRNRGLDMMPLWRHLDEALLLAELPDAGLVKARPTFHYRLPDTRLSDPGWGVLREWERWLAVERLAADPAALEARCAAMLAEFTRGWGVSLMDGIKGWIER